jgi:hypothetical protein
MAINGGEKRRKLIGGMSAWRKAYQLAAKLNIMKRKMAASNQPKKSWRTAHEKQRLRRKRLTALKRKICCGGGGVAKSAAGTSTAATAATGGRNRQSKLRHASAKWRRPYHSKTKISWRRLRKSAYAAGNGVMAVSAIIAG